MEVEDASFLRHNLRAVRAIVGVGGIDWDRRLVNVEAQLKELVHVIGNIMLNQIAKLHVPKVRLFE